MAMRLSASPCTHDYGALTLRVQLHHRVKYLRSVPATVFLPRPDVDSAVVRLEPRDPNELPEHDDELLLKLIRIGFSQRRKQLRKLMREYARDWNALASCLNIDPNARAEDLSFCNGSLLQIASRRRRAKTWVRRTTSGSQWSIRTIASVATQAARKCMGITCCIAPFISSFSIRSGMCICSNAPVRKTGIRRNGTRALLTT